MSRRRRSWSSAGLWQISAAERDASPLVCNGEQFMSPGTLENWFVLR